MTHSNRIAGVVYLDVPASAYERLDRFEGEMYARRTLSIDMDSGGRLTAATYIVRPEYVDRLEEAMWDFSELILTPALNCIKKSGPGNNSFIERLFWYIIALDGRPQAAPD
jgi:hypothetical protein